ncbi:MAG: hypothetical protein Kow0010_23740 [Dehalococcoidia bacterium]
MLIEERGRVLLVRRGPGARLFPHTWSLPGDDLRPGETAVEGARRVAREVLGIEALDVHVERRHPPPSPFQDSRGDDRLVRVTSHTGEIARSPGRVDWYTPDDLSDIVIFREARDALRSLLHTGSMVRNH